MKLYKLFKNENVKILLDMSYYLDDIIESLGYCIDSPLVDYTITENEKEYAHIRSIEDYVRLRYIDNSKQRKLEK